MSTTLLVVIIFAMVISPIFWLVPSRRQRYQMHMRKMALHAGIKVRLEKFELNGEKHPAVAYRWMRDADDRKQARRFRLAHVPRMEKDQFDVDTAGEVYENRHYFPGENRQSPTAPSLSLAIRS